jgi:serine/threonine protein kinase
VSLLTTRPRRLAGRYVLGDLLGRGGMADVHRAYDELLERPVAVKLLRDVAGTDRFRSEARILGRLTHPGLVTVLDAGVTDGVPWLVLELVEGGTLADACRAAPLAPVRTAQIGADLAEALGHVHRSGLVHRDVKPGNILLAHDGRVLLTDFGVARLVEGAVPATATGITMGTAAYLAPEQVRGERVTGAADVYALGLVLLEALTGRREYPGAPTEAALARLSRPPEVPRSLPAGWRRVLQAMTAEAPAVRPASEKLAGVLRGLSEADAGSTALLVVPAVEPAPAGSTRTVPLVLPGSPAGAQGPRRPLTSRIRRTAVGAGVVVVAVLVVAGTAALRPHPTAHPVPGTVPGTVRADLQQLHRAVEAR